MNASMSHRKRIGGSVGFMAWHLCTYGELRVRVAMQGFEARGVMRGRLPPQAILGVVLLWFRCEGDRLYPGTVTMTRRVKSGFTMLNLE